MQGYIGIRTSLPTPPSISVSVPAFGAGQAPSNETVTAKSSDGSIIIRLSKAYLDSLPVSTHTLTVYLKGEYEGQSVSVNIRIGSPSAGGATDPDVPKTGDAATPMLWLGLMLLAGAGLSVSAVRRRKRQNG